MRLSVFCPRPALHAGRTFLYFRRAGWAAAVGSQKKQTDRKRGGMIVRKYLLVRKAPAK